MLIHLLQILTPHLYLLDTMVELEVLRCDAEKLGRPRKGGKWDADGVEGGREPGACHFTPGFEHDVEGEGFGAAFVVDVERDGRGRTGSVEIVEHAVVDLAGFKRVMPYLETDLWLRIRTCRCEKLIVVKKEEVKL